MSNLYAKQTASVLALGLALALMAAPALAQDHGRGGHGGGRGDRGGQGSSGQSWSGQSWSGQSWSGNDRAPATRSDDSSRSWNNHAPLAGKPRPQPAQPQVQRPAQPQPSTSAPAYGQNAHHWGGRPGNDNNDRPDRNDRPGRDDWNGGNRGSGNGHDWNGGNRGSGNGHDWNGGSHGPGNDHNWNGGGRGPDRGRPGNDHNWNGGHAPHYDWHNDRRFHGYSGVRYGFYFFPGTGYYRVPSQWYGHRWMSGEYLPDFFFSYRIYDWDYYGLPMPPYGCAWYFVGEDAVLVDLDTGRIIDVYYDVY